VEQIAQAHVAQDLQVSVLDLEHKLKQAKLVVALCLEARLGARRLLLPPQSRHRLLLLRTMRLQALLQLVDRPSIPPERKTSAMVRELSSSGASAFLERIVRVLVAPVPLASALGLAHKLKLEKRDADSSQATLLRLLMQHR
jgi:hypothetical protein